MRRVVAAVLAVVLAAALGVAIVRSAAGGPNDGPAAGASASAGDDVGRDGPMPVRGISGSEKIPFLTDPRVIDRLSRLGLELPPDADGRRPDDTTPACLLRIADHPVPALGPTLAPAALDDLLQRAMAKDPDQRPTAAAVFGAGLAGLAAPANSP